MNALVIRALKRRIATPLIGDHPVVHDAPHDLQYLIVKEELRGEARRLEGHRKKVAMRAAVGLVAARSEISEETRPKSVPASLDQGRGKMFSKYAVAFVPDLGDPVLNPHQCAAHRGPVYQAPLAVCVRNCSVYHCSGNRSLTFAARFELLGFAEPRTSESGCRLLQDTPHSVCALR